MDPDIYYPERGVRVFIRAYYAAVLKFKELN